MLEHNSRANPSEQTRVKEQNLETALDQIRQSLQGLKFGQVIAIVQDGVVVQIERIEKKRLV